MPLDAGKCTLLWLSNLNHMNLKKFINGYKQTDPNIQKCEFIICYYKKHTKKTMTCMNSCYKCKQELGRM